MSAFFHLLIADDHSLFRETLKTYLRIMRPRITVEEVSDFTSLLNRIKKQSKKIDLMLVDFAMPDMAGRTGFELIGRFEPQIPFAMMSGVADSDDIDFVLKCGARGYLSKTLSGKAVIQAIDQMLCGEIFEPINSNYSSLFENTLPLNKAEGKKTLPDIPLTPREQEVLELLELGLTNKDIATELALKPVTVKLHVRGILRKLNLENRTQAALKARVLREATAYE